MYVPKTWEEEVTVQGSRVTVETDVFHGYIGEYAVESFDGVTLNTYEVHITLKSEALPRELMRQLWPELTFFYSTADWEYDADHMILTMREFFDLERAEKVLRFFSRHLDGIIMLDGFFNKPRPWTDEHIKHLYRWLTLNYWQDGRDEETPLADEWQATTAHSE